MSESGPLLDPEVEAILQEVARDPDSILLRVDRPKALKALARGEEMVVRGRWGLSSAERQLLEVHREEAAYLLRLAYYERAERAGLDRDRGVIVRGAESAVQALRERTIAERLTRERRALEGDQNAIVAIDDGLGLLASDDWQLIDFPIASLRLAPNMAARSYIAVESSIAGNLHFAKRAFQELLREPLPPVRRARYLIRFAQCLGSMGRLDEARQVTQQAVEVAPGEATAALSWLATSIQVGREEQAREAIRYLDQGWSARSSRVTNWVSAVKKQKTKRVWAPTPEAAPLVKRLVEVSGDTAGLVLELMLN